MAISISSRPIKCRFVFVLSTFVLGGIANSASAVDAVVANWAERVRVRDKVNLPNRKWFSSFLETFPTPKTTGTDLSVGDFDDDGDLDVASIWSGRVRIYDGLNHETGPFWESPAFFAPGAAGGIVAGDFNGNGSTDFAASFSNRIRIWEPSTQASVDLTTGLGGESAYWASGETSDLSNRGLSAGDFDNDTNLEVAVVTGGRLSIYEPATTPHLTALPIWESPAFADPSGGTVAGHFDGDTNLDVAASIGDRLRIWEPATQASATGAFWISNTLPGSGETFALTAGEFDGDTNLELAAAIVGRVRIWEPNTQSSGSGEQWFSNDMAGEEITAVAAGDFDGNLNLDITAAVLGNFSTWEPGTQPADSDPLNVGDPKFTATSMVLLPGGQSSLINAHIGDLNRDGHVNQVDLDTLLSNFNTFVTPGVWAEGDIHYNPGVTLFGKVDIRDLGALLNNWTGTLPPDLSALNVPEPTGAALAAIVLVIVAGWNRPRRAIPRTTDHRPRTTDQQPWTTILACAAILLCSIARQSLATTSVPPNSLIFVEVPNPALPGYVTTDLLITTTTDWQATSLHVDLTAGDIFQAPLAQGGTTTAPPTPSDIASFPMTEFDSYMHVAGNPVLTAGIGGNAGAPPGPERFDTSDIDVTWFNTGPSDIGTIGLARISISNDAVGTWAYHAVTQENSEGEDLGDITEGSFVAGAGAANDVRWVGAVSGWQNTANWSGGALPDVGSGQDALINNGGTAQITSSLGITPRFIEIGNGTVEQTAGLVNLTNGGPELGIPDTSGSSVYNLSGGELRLDASPFTDVNIGLGGEGTSTFDISGNGFLNQTGVQDAGRGIQVGRSSTGQLLLSDSGRLFTAGTLSNGGDSTTGPGTISIFGDGVQIDAQDSYTQDATATLDLHINGISPINTQVGAVLAGFLQVDFLVEPTAGQEFTIITTATGVTGTFDGGVSATGLGTGQTMEVNYAGGASNNDVVLQVTGGAILQGDFNLDLDADGADFLLWQRGGSPNPLSQSDLDGWAADYGTGAPLAAAASVPEPASLLLVVIALAGITVRRWGV